MQKRKIRKIIQNIPHSFQYFNFEETDTIVRCTRYTYLGGYIERITVIIKLKYSSAIKNSLSILKTDGRAKFH